MDRTKKWMSVGLLILGWVATPAVLADTVLHLGADGTPVASLEPSAPIATALANHDPGRDTFPGLVVARGGDGISETDPILYQQWMTAPGTVTLDGPTSLEFWAAMREFGAGKRGVVNAYLLDCDPTGTSCVEIADGSRDILDWSAGWGSWSPHAIGFGRVTYTVPDGRSLAVRVVVGSDSDDDMMFAYDTADFPSRVTDGAENDNAIDCDFADWTDGSGTEFVASDQGGPDDWASPSRLDVTLFAASSNLADAVHVLMGLDDAPVNGGVVATLIDTDLDNNANFALVADVDGAETVVELYRCDDTLTDGCGSAVRRRTYPVSQSCTAQAAGPWNTDTLVEVALPFGDVDVTGGPVVLTSLVSYAAASLLNSPKDAVLGVGTQDYQAGIYFDLSTGNSRLTSGVGSGFVVRRSTDPASVRAATPHAGTASAPFDDLPGTFADGQAYYYVVEKEDDVPVMLSAHANRYHGVVRLGFDDNAPLSAPADAVESTVTAAVTSVPADGTAVSTITVVPRDTYGEPIGAGCEIQVDALTLAPAALAAPVIDGHDGSYSVRIASTSTGVGTVVVTVEGIVLASQPTIAFTSP